MVSAATDLRWFLTALVRGELVTERLLEEMCTPESKVGNVLGIFVQEVGGAMVINHNGGIAENAARMCFPTAALFLRRSLELRGRRRPVSGRPLRGALGPPLGGRLISQQGGQKNPAVPRSVRPDRRLRGTSAATGVPRFPHLARTNRPRSGAITSE
jgi:hypothetical protein